MGRKRLFPLIDIGARSPLSLSHLLTFIEHIAVLQCTNFSTVKASARSRGAVHFGVGLRPGARLWAAECAAFRFLRRRRAYVPPACAYRSELVPALFWRREIDLAQTFAFGVIGHKCGRCRGTEGDSVVPVNINQFQ